MRRALQARPANRASAQSIRAAAAAQQTATLPPFDDFDHGADGPSAARPTNFTRPCRQDIADAEARLVQRQALAGMLWSQAILPFRHPALAERRPGRSRRPRNAPDGPQRRLAHLNNADIISMPDKWEYPWYAAWDLAFHCVAFALIDPDFAKSQLMLLTREWYMHPNGQLPAYEWAFGDVNPPVHAWAAWRVYQMDRDAERRQGDRGFLERVLPQADAELHLVGQPQGLRRAATSSKAASSDWTISACSTAPRRCRPAATSTSPTAPPGWRCTR